MQWVRQQPLHFCAMQLPSNSVFQVKMQKPQVLAFYKISQFWTVKQPRDLATSFYVEFA